MMDTGALNDAVPLTSYNNPEKMPLDYNLNDNNLPILTGS